MSSSQLIICVPSGSSERGRCRRGRSEFPYFTSKLRSFALVLRIGEKRRKAKKNEKAKKKKKKKKGKIPPTPSTPTPLRTTQCQSELTEFFAELTALSLESYGKPSILEADDFLGACCRNAITPQKPEGPVRTENATTIERNSELVCRSLFTTPPPPNIYYAADPSLRGKMSVIPRRRSPRKVHKACRDSKSQCDSQERKRHININKFFR